MNNVLTLEEVLALPEGARVWVEYNRGRWSVPVIDRVAKFDSQGKAFIYVSGPIPGGGVCIGLSHYGSWHRAWSLPQPPTEDELAKWPWEEGGQHEV